VTESKVFIKASNDEFLDSTDLCLEGLDSANARETCTVPMALLGERPYSLRQGDPIFAKVQSTNDIGTSRPSDEGSGAQFTRCLNGVPDKVLV
jgi:hypothetical protein